MRSNQSTALKAQNGTQNNTLEKIDEEEQPDDANNLEDVISDQNITLNIAENENDIDLEKQRKADQEENERMEALEKLKNQILEQVKQEEEKLKQQD